MASMKENQVSVILQFLGLTKQAKGGVQWRNIVRTLWHNLSDETVKVKAELDVGRVKRNEPYVIKPRKSESELNFKLTEDGSLVIKGKVTLVGQAVTVGRDGT